MKASILAYNPDDFEREILHHVMAYGYCFSHYADAPLVAVMRRKALQRLRLNGMLRTAGPGLAEVTPAGRRAIAS